MTGQSKLVSSIPAPPASLDRFSPENQLPFWVEVGVVGGLGLMVYIGPPIARAVWSKISLIRPCMKKVYQLAKNEVMLRWEPLNQKRKRGSIVRVIASVLPDRFFEKSHCRVFIHLNKNSNDEQRRVEHMLKENIDSVLGITSMRGIEEDRDGDGTCEEEGIIVAFQLDTNTSGEIEESEDVSSNPEGWEYTGDSVFHPVSSSTQVICSTPTRGHRLQNMENRDFLNDSLSTVGDDCDGKTKEDIENLKNMVQQLMIQMTTLNQNLSQNQNQTERTFALQQSALASNLLDSVNDITRSFPSPPTPSTLGTATIPACPSTALPPPPPPPPPPPMPLMPLMTPQPLIRGKKTPRELLPPKKAAPSLTDVLKELPNVKLRKIQRSPGGTPKKQSKPDLSNQLESILKKRFESMHSPPCDSDDEFNDKENGFEDSYSENVEPFSCKNNLMSKLESPRKSKKSGNRRSSDAKSSNENRTPFGQHLLKKRDQHQTAESSGPSKVLRQHNA